MRGKLLVLVALALAVTGSAVALASAGENGAVEPQLTAVRQVTASYHDVANAIADGYVPFSDCVAAPGLGTMGIHYGKPALVEDDAVDALQPELLLYVPSENGLRLVGVEYFKVDDDQDLATDADRPTLFGQAFDGPMEGHDVGMPRHYDLHVWLWQANPSGIFAQFNPNLSC